MSSTTSSWYLDLLKKKGLTGKKLVEAFQAGKKIWTELKDSGFFAGTALLDQFKLEVDQMLTPTQPATS